MIRLGIIGTGEIVKKFLTQAKHNNDVTISCLYSRDIKKAQAFCSEFNIATATDNFKDMFKHIDAVYIASPNGLHFEQTKLFLENNKHVLVEKTIVFKSTELAELMKIANQKNLILLEAFISLHLPICATLKKELAKIEPIFVNLNFSRFSSRIPDVKIGIYNSVFDSNLGKGSTYDALVYPLQLALYLLGKVKTVRAFTKMLPNNVAISNHLILVHESGTISTINCSKEFNSFIPSEFIGENQTLILKSVHPLQGIKIIDSKTGIVKNDLKDTTNRETLMTYELQDFIEMIIKLDYTAKNHWLNYSLMNLRVIEAAIKSNQEEGGAINIYEN